jgi:hypothetical protein
MSEQPERTICQSCGMPLEGPDDYGTAANGAKITDYCRYCFQNGAFTEPDITLRDMIAKCAGIITQQGIMTEPKAQAFMGEIIPKLKRWQRE